MHSFKAKINIIGINPFVLLPAAVLKALFTAAGKDKGPIPVHGSINGHPFKQTLVKYSGKWRLYLNTPMRLAAGIDVGDMADISMAFDNSERSEPMHPKLAAALKKNKTALAVFNALPASRQKEIKRYINHLKQAASIERNVEKAIEFLLGNARFIGRDKP